MKLRIIFAFIGLAISGQCSAEQQSPIKDVNYDASNTPTLSIQNLSSELIAIDIYGQEFLIKPASGISYDCQGYAFVELQFKGIIHDFFEVSCPSRVSIAPDFKFDHE